MATSDERREVAKRLRDEAGGFRRFEKEWGYEPTTDLGDVTAVFQDVAHFAGLDGTVRTCVLLDRLADLIDRPTCHICETDHEFEDSVRCDRCRMTFMRPWEPFKYCPECGARVVTDDD